MTISATGPTYSVQHTFDNVQATGHRAAEFYNYGALTNTWFNHPIVVSQIANCDGNYAFPVKAIRVIATYGTTPSTVTIKLNQSGGGWR